ncbi:MAG: LON peptidase substrate-binding domain-containing protein, partial [Patescibacteria group bacterium]
MAQKDTNFLQDYFGAKDRKEAPLVPLKDLVVFPRIAMPIVIRRAKSQRALEEAMRRDHVLLFVAQNKESVGDPAFDDLYKVGTLGKVREMVKQPDGTVRILVEGFARAKVVEVVSTEPFLKAKVAPFPEPQVKKTERVEALMYSALNQFRQAVNMGANVPFDILLVILNISDPWQLGDLIAVNLEMKVDERQSILEAADVEAKLDMVSKAIGRQIKVLQIASKIQAETGKELDKMQKEVFLREQMKSIEKELGMNGAKTEMDDVRERIKKAGMPPEVEEKAIKELARLQAMPSFSPEISYIRAYLDWLADLPWAIKDQTDIDIIQAKKILETDHYGLEKVKERILEYLAVQKLVGKIKGPILCFVGPPGTGKTSIGKSIARAIGRKFYRMSLGGIRD